MSLTPSLILTLFFLLIVIVAIFTSAYVVPQQHNALIERFGKFVRISTPGLNFKIPLVEQVASRMSLQIQQLVVETNTKTKDNVTIEIFTSIQLMVNPNKVADAYYKLLRPSEQISSYVLDVVRSKIPSMILDEVYENKESIAQSIEEHLTSEMQEFGYIIRKSLVTDIRPDQRVLDAMNQINEQQRLRDAAQAKAEAEKIIKVKNAEAEAEAMKLAGIGIANQRREIIEGLKESIASLKSVVGEGIAPIEIMQLVMTTQYFDALKEIGANSRTNTLLLPHTSQGIHQLTEQMIAANLVNKSKA